VDLVVPLADAARCTPDRVGPKAATLARLARAGLPVPEAFCLTVDAYRAHLAAAGVNEDALRVASAEDEHDARRHALAVRLGLERVALDSTLAPLLDHAWDRLLATGGALAAVRSSALLEDTPATSFAGQFDTFLGIATHVDLVTAVRACWAALWSTRALRYMRSHGVDPATTGMAVLVQRLVSARASGGALSRTPGGEVLITGTWGLGSAVAQGEVVPDRYLVPRVARGDLVPRVARGDLVPRDGVEVERGRKDRLVRCAIDAGPVSEPVPPDRVDAPCLDEVEARELARMVVDAEALVGRPVEIEWALGDDGLHILQARALRVDAPHAPDELWLRHPGLRGQPAGIGWGTGRARLVLTEHDLELVEAGDVVVTSVAGPALTAVLGRVAGVVAELGGSTSHLASLARERGIPAVLGVPRATRTIPTGATVAVDGVSGVVRWMA
jgi:pyruvate,water dikinase